MSTWCDLGYYRLQIHPGALLSFPISNSKVPRDVKCLSKIRFNFQKINYIKVDDYSVVAEFLTAEPFADTKSLSFRE